MLFHVSRSLDVHAYLGLAMSRCILDKLNTTISILHLRTLRLADVDPSVKDVRLFGFTKNGEDISARSLTGYA
ncbi:predicted protein [Lichtheimia corymbifera JMRC:FSU:9682]|uniref:Uncharacterized protein n=1 Tax=Lichtheimia corymbifera JMRC:FSU:9682 TaxID=1263082 RepID=A0A068S0D4_9FUNG|nr:predicted protein [Lichtheimia corymbifera JMRC:FSU:9682]